MKDTRIKKEKAKKMSVASTTTNLKINPEYSKLVNPLSNLEYQVLKNSISEKGLHLPIIVNQENVILDGHHRYKICKELAIEPIVEVKRFDDLLDEKEFVIEINVKRRHLNTFQKSMQAYNLEEIEKEKARLRQIKLAGTRPNSNSNSTLPSFEGKVINDSEKGKTADIVSKKVGISRGTYERAKKIIEEGTEDQKKRLEEGKSKINKEYEKLRKDRKRQEFLEQINNNIESKKDRNENDDNCKLFLGDLLEESAKHIPDNSIDLIFTDPPYGYHSIHLYEGLARLAVRVLKPGGSLVFFVGHIILDEVFNIFHRHISDLKYWWTFAVKHSGHHNKVYPRHVFAEWKPLLWYVKGDKINDLTISNTIDDYIESTSPSKALHEWERSMAEAEYIIKNLTLANQTVLDPMIGTGTTGIVAYKKLHNRKFIGIEKNEETFQIAKARINNNYTI